MQLYVARKNLILKPLLSGHRTLYTSLKLQVSIRMYGMYNNYCSFFLWEADTLTAATPENWQRA